MGNAGEFEHRVTPALVDFSEDAVPQEEPRGREEAPRVVDLQQLVPLGGVFHIDALQLPPQVLDVGDWSIVEVREEREQPWGPGTLRAAPEVWHCCHMPWTRLPEQQTNEARFADHLFFICER